MIYVASPYSNESRGMRRTRFKKACGYVAALMRKGKIAFSPVAHSHSISEYFALPTDWEFWKPLDEAMIAACSEVHVLKLDGWEDSKGVQSEIGLAISLKKPVTYVECD